jgi:hypothetical protein
MHLGDCRIEKSRPYCNGSKRERIAEMKTVYAQNTVSALTQAVESFVQNNEILAFGIACAALSFACAFIAKYI